MNGLMISESAYAVIKAQCGLRAHANPGQYKAKYIGPELIGMRFGSLTISAFIGRQRWLVIVECVCDCGATCRARLCDLQSAHKKSCGCMWRQHGLSNTPTHRSWLSMIDRCTNPNSKNWLNYGGRGITVCGRWLNSFNEFIGDMGTRPEGGFSIERIDNNGNYEPGNCRWATAGEQGNNRRANHYLTLDGKRQTIEQWSREVGIGAATIRYRLKIGWSDSRALTVRPYGARCPRALAAKAAGVNAPSAETIRLVIEALRKAEEGF